MNYNKIFIKLASELNNFEDNGKVATYIPELSKVNPIKFGVHLTTIKDKHSSFGDSNEKFSIQSISKVLSLTLAYQLEDEKLWNRVGVEPSGTPFNSLIQLEADLGIPRNPFINSGALVVCDILVSYLKNPKKDFIEFVRTVAGKASIDYSSKIAASEKSTGYRNTALINLMKSFGNIKNDIDIVMDFYFNLCSIEMTCKELSQTFIYLSTYGVSPYSEKRILSKSKSKRINAIMWFL